MPSEEAKERAVMSRTLAWSADTALKAERVEPKNDPAHEHDPRGVPRQDAVDRGGGRTARGMLDANARSHPLAAERAHGSRDTADMHAPIVARSVALAVSMMLAGSCTVSPDDGNTTFGGPVSVGGPGGDTAATGQDPSTGMGATGTATHGSTTADAADETADASSGAPAPGGSTSAGSSGEATTNATNAGSTSDGPMCDAFCRGCACPSDMCTMCCALQDMVDQCVGGSCFCF
jgi:hypothetical protein